MKVKIKAYPNWVGPYQLVEKLCFWIPKEKDEYGFPTTAERVHNWGEKFADSWAGKLWYKIDGARTNWLEKRRVRVHIDRWDTWGMYETVGYIVLPMLKQIKETKQGSPMVDDEDLPEHLRHNNWTRNESSQYDLFADEAYDSLVWDSYVPRWNWVLDEMIFAFESIVGNNTDWESKYHTGNIEFLSIPLDENDNELGPGKKLGEKTDPEIKDKVKMWRMERGPNDTSQFDKEGHRCEGERIANGFRLFGKYYQALWD